MGFVSIGVSGSRAASLRHLTFLSIVLSGSPPAQRESDGESDADGRPAEDLHGRPVPMSRLKAISIKLQ
jgi:hypothetical protein